MQAKDVRSPIEEISARVQAERLRARLSLNELARRAGVAKSTLSQIETAAGNPSVETLWAIATALDLPFAQLVAAADVETRVVRADQRAAISAGSADFAATLLTSGSPGARRDLYVIAVQPDRPRASDPHPRGTVEHVVAGAGRIRVGPIDAPVDLHPGDYSIFRGDTPHLYEALDADAWFVLVMEHPDHP